MHRGVIHNVWDDPSIARKINLSHYFRKGMAIDMLTDEEIVLKYKPYVMADEQEPFAVSGVGYTIFHSTKRSISFPKRTIVVDPKKVEYVIEYAIWYDYDIQHLYELEHLWIYVGHQGEVVDAEGSFHGKYLKMVLPETGRLHLEDGTHLIVYSQPGKHAFLPKGNLVHLIPNWYESCNEKAGSDGLVIADMFQDQLETNEELQKKVEEYIKLKFAFVPTLKFRKTVWENELFMPYEKLFESIPGRVKRQLDNINMFFKD